MSYRYDVFVSYGDIGRIHSGYEGFLGKFSTYLAQELGRRPKIFIDDMIEAGHSWPHALAYALARSRVLVALWTPLYFKSPWCISEQPTCMPANSSAA